MKKAFLTLGAVLAFGIASAQSDTTTTTARSAQKTEKNKPAAGQKAPQKNKKDARSKRGTGTTPSQQGTTVQPSTNDTRKGAAGTTTGTGTPAKKQ